mmetsp:Transcript_51619/g.83742  ORF Transcript_51619/g.83742 Transcript_51619/m.83742 type:complete len:387 (-) Transcript_51619:156-1316(-)
MTRQSPLLMQAGCQHSIASLGRLPHFPLSFRLDAIGRRRGPGSMFAVGAAVAGASAAGLVARNGHGCKQRWLPRRQCKVRRLSVKGVSSRGPGSEAEFVDLNQKRADFTYRGGTVPRPWDQFTGRWAAIERRLSEAFGTGSGGKRFRLIDIGSNYGFFSLQTAVHHPRAEVIGVEGSAGVGNGKAGVLPSRSGVLSGAEPEILQTPAVQNQLRWTKRLGLSNCFVAPEVWDLAHIQRLAAKGWPICDATLLLSVVHHIDRLSLNQYEEASFSRTEGFIKLLGTFLRLANLHFIELPGERDLRSVFKAYGPSPKDVLQAAADASGLRWQLTGPLFATRWFGNRELWELRCKDWSPPLSTAEAEVEAEGAEALGDVFPSLYGTMPSQS